MKPITQLLKPTVIAEMLLITVMPVPPTQLVAVWKILSALKPS